MHSFIIEMITDRVYKHYVAFTKLDFWYFNKISLGLTTSLKKWKGRETNKQTNTLGHLISRSYITF